MLRAAGSVVVGYLVMFVVVFATFTVAYLAMGTEGAFRPGTYDVTGLWLLVSLVLTLVASMVGGLVCATIGRTRGPSIALAIVVVLISVGFAIPGMVSPEAVALGRDPSAGVFQAMQNAREPTWATIVMPLVAAIGVLIGGRFVVRRTGALGDE